MSFQSDQQRKAVMAMLSSSRKRKKELNPPYSGITDAKSLGGRVLDVGGSEGPLPGAVVLDKAGRPHIKHDLRRAPYPISPESFDAIHSSRALGDALIKNDPKMADSIAAEWNRILKPGGKIAMYELSEREMGKGTGGSQVVRSLMRLGYKIIRKRNLDFDFFMELKKPTKAKK